MLASSRQTCERRVVMEALECRRLFAATSLDNIPVTTDPFDDTPEQLKKYLSSFDPHIVALTGPVHLRAEQALAAIDAGIHVLAEKPFTIDPADAWAIERRARDRGVHVVLCYAWNEMGISERAQRLIGGPPALVVTRVLDGAGTGER